MMTIIICIVTAILIAIIIQQAIMITIIMKLATMPVGNLLGWPRLARTTALTYLALS